MPIMGPLPRRTEGFMQPFRSADLAAQVGRQIVELHPAITNRGSFSQGGILARLDDSAERSALIQTQADIDATNARLELTKTLLQRTQTLRNSGSVSQATLDEVQSAQQELVANLNNLNASQIILDWRKIVAPFDDAVLSKQVDIGTVIAASQSTAQIFTRGRMEVDVPVREADAALISDLFDGAEAPAVGSVRFAG